jgi:hypothetical protein
MVPEMSVKPNITLTRCHINQYKESGVDVIHRVYKLRLSRRAVFGVCHTWQTTLCFLLLKSKPNRMIHRSLNRKKEAFLLFN